MNPQFTSSYELYIKYMLKVVSPNIPGLSELLVLSGDNCSSPTFDNTASCDAYEALLMYILSPCML